MNRTLEQTQIAENIFMVNINYEDLVIDRNEIISSLGHTKNDIPEHFADTINLILEKLPHLIEIKAGYAIVDYLNDDKNDSALVGNTQLSLHKIVAGQLKRSEKAALFLCTTGNKMEQWSKQVLAQGDTMLGYFIDVTASVVVETAVNILHDHIKNEMSKNGLSITNRYSPGYCNWSVSEQHLLFSFFPKNFCGVTLTESALMIPIKSVSGIIGIGAGVKYRDYLCDTCGIKDCTYRSKRHELLS